MGCEEEIANERPDSLAAESAGKLILLCLCHARTAERRQPPGVSVSPGSRLPQVRQSFFFPSCSRAQSERSAWGNARPGETPSPFQAHDDPARSSAAHPPAAETELRPTSPCPNGTVSHARFARWLNGLVRLFNFHVVQCEILYLLSVRQPMTEDDTCNKQQVAPSEKQHNLSRFSPMSACM